MLTIFFSADMADHTFNAKSLLFQSLTSRVNLCLFTTADDYMCTFLSKPLSDRKTDAISKNTDYIQFAELNIAHDYSANSVQCNLNYSNLVNK